MPDLAAMTDAEVPSLLGFYKDLHTYPELSLREEATAGKVASELRAAGLEVTEKVGGHGVVGVLKNGDGPTILIRTDLDALPVKEQTGLPYASAVTVKDEQGNLVPVMHACGHDIHMSCFVGTARVLAKSRATWKGTLVFIGQPAEERVLGARFMLRDGLFSRFPKPDKALALHVWGDMPAGTVGLTSGYALANVNTVEIIVHGVGGHGSAPQTTKDPIVLASEIVLALQTIVSREIRPGDPAVVTVGTIHGGTKNNIISDEVRMGLTLRSYDDGVRQHLISAIQRITRGLGIAAGLPEEKLPEVKVSEEAAPALFNQPEMVVRLRKVFEDALGQENVVIRDPVMGAEDFAEYGRTKEKVPICLFWLGSVEAGRVAAARAAGEMLPSLHSPLYAPDPEPTIRTGIRAMTAAVIEMLDPAR
jgi:amidohydrolase